MSISGQALFSQQRCCCGHAVMQFGLRAQPAHRALVPCEGGVGGARGEQQMALKEVCVAMSLELISWALRALGVGSRAG